MSKVAPLRRIIRAATAERSGAERAGSAWRVPHLRVNQRHADEGTIPLACTANESTEELAMAMLAEHKARLEEDARIEAEALEARLTRDLEAVLRERDVERERHVAEEAKLRSGMRRVVSALRASVAELAAQKIEATLSVEERVAALAVEIARRVVGAEVEDRRHDVRALVTGVLGEARRRFPAQSAKLRLSPSDAELLGGADLGQGVELIVDSDLPAGEARVLTDDGQVWDGVFTRLDALSAVILGTSGAADSEEQSRAA